MLAALPARVGHELLLGFLLAGQENLLGIDDHHEIAGIQVRRIDRFVPAAQDVGCLNGQASQHRAIGIDHVPLAFFQIDFRQMRLHHKSC